MNFSLSGLDLKLLFMVSGAYYKSGLYTVPAEIKKPKYPYMRMILRDRRATLRFGGGRGGNVSDSIWGGHKTPFLTNSL